MIENIKRYNLTHPQQRIWYTEKLHPGTGMWNNAGTLKIKGCIDYVCLERALNVTLEENESIRLRIGADKGIPYQYVAPYEPYHAEILDFSELGLGKLYEWDSRQSEAPMLLTDSCLYYFAFLHISPTECGLYAKFHHIISDAISIVEFSNQVMENYQTLLKGEEPVKHKRPTYADYVATEQEYQNSKRFIYDKEYWTQRFSDFSEPTIIKPRKTNDMRVEARRKVYVLNEAFSGKIRDYCSSAGISVFALFLSALAIYINRVTGKKDVVIGAPVANRSTLIEKNMFGMFVSTVPVRIDISDELSFTEFSQIVSNEWFSALKHQKYPYDVLMHELHQTHKNLDSLYDVTLSYQFGKFHKNSEQFTYEGRWHFSGSQAGALNIHVNDREDEGRFILDYDYHTSLFYAKEIEYFHIHLINIIRDMIRHPDKPLYLLDLMDEEERKRILHSFNDTDRDYPQGETLTGLLRQSFKTAADVPAVICAGDTITYAELDARSDALAAYLAGAGVTKNSIVGLVSSRNIDLIVSVAAILKAGGAFLPIDPELPPERIAYMLSDSGARTLLVSPEHVWKCPGHKEMRVVRTDIRPEPVRGFQSSCTPDSLAYIIYTSGSTGQPKGVQIEHHSIVHFAYFMREKYDLSPGGRMLCAGSISFDLSILEFVPALTNGLTLVLAQEHEANMPKNLVKLIQANHVNMMFVTPGRMELLLSDRSGQECIREFREIGLGGDVLSEALLANVQQSTRARITNLYGPTEITICCTMADVTHAKIPSIGHPLPGVKAYILDPHRSPVPIGVPGELYIGGPGVARGYVNRPELDGERFIDSPFSSGARLYRTGDLARWYPQGEIEFLGRIDKQVKIRGFRIELGEIENRLLKVPGVTSCVVTDHADSSGRRFLCAYISGDIPKNADIKARLNRELPSYMIPSVFIKMDKIPFNVSGKVDRSQLPDPIAYLDDQKENDQPPETMTEQLLADIWSAELGLARISRNDNFFDLGGDSLSILHVMTQVEQQFHVAFRHEDVYRSPRLMDMAEIIDKAEQSSYRPIVRAPEQRDYPVSSVQQRMWVVSQGKDTVAYNIPVACEIRGAVDSVRLQDAFRKLVARHSVLRTSFRLSKNTLKQCIHKRVRFRLGTIDCEKKNLRKVLKSLLLPFDLTSAPLMRATLIHVSDQYHILFMDMHHIICDQHSLKLLLQDLASLYRGEDLPPVALEYKDYAVWQQEFLQSENVNMQCEYWKGVLAGELPLLNLHTDRPRPAQQQLKGARFSFRIERETEASLRGFTKQYGGTLFMAVLAVYNVLLMKYTGQEDIIVGTPSSGRTREELAGITGVFLNTLPIRCYPACDQSFLDFYRTVMKTCAAAFANEDCPLERILAEIALPRDPSRNPLFDTMLVVTKHNLPNPIAGTQAKVYPFDPGFSKMDLTLEVVEDEGGLSCSFEYNKRLYKKETIKRMAAHFCRLVSMLPELPETRIADVEMMSPQEIQRITQGFNDTDRKLESGLSIQSIFEEQARCFPDKTALIVGGERMTFAALNRRANAIAFALKEKGVGRNTVVALALKRSFDLMAAILGVLKAGGAYLPLDITFPADRICYMLSDCGARFMLSDGSLRVCYDGEVIRVQEIPENSRTENPERTDRMDDIAYVMYTSGSTGQPKGTQLLRRGLLNLYEGVKKPVGYSATQTSISITTVSFDIFICDALMPLLFGATLVLCTEEELHESRMIAALIEKYDVKFIQATPTRMSLMLEEASFRSALAGHIEKIMVGGEMVPISLVRQLRKICSARVINAYGPTETTVWSSFQELTKASRVTIGSPICNTRIYILDKNKRPVPIGVFGEAYISGAGVASGYINRPELTREKFIPDPFWPGHTMYQTGDVCAYLSDGDIEIAGRVDHQVKIRGHRIELGEIETEMLGVKGVTEAVVREWGTGAEKYLCAYYISESGITEDAIRSHLFMKLPAYMVPGQYVRMQAMPMTLSGKINRKALEEPRAPEHGIPVAAIDMTDMTPEEKKMARVWARVLKKGGIGPQSRFIDMGGDSLGVIKIQTAVLPYGWTLQYRDFFEGKTLREICAHIKTPEKTELKKKRDAHIPEFAHLKPVKMENVLLTGATGYLGAHLIAELAEKPNVHVFCVVRGSDANIALKYLRETMIFYFGLKKCIRYLTRLTVLKGDITEKNLGLGDEELRLISGKVDTIIHCAAITDHMGRAELFNRVNVAGTRNVVNLTKTLNAALIHISTGSVSGTYYVNDLKKKGPFSEDDYDIGQNYADNEYVRTKFIAEGFVIDALKQGINARIIRVGTLTGTTGGKFQSNPARNAFANRIVSICNIGSVPESALGISIEMTPVDACADAIVRLALLDEKRAVHHVYNTRRITVADLLDMLKQSDIYIDVLPDETFRQKVSALVRKGKLAMVSGLVSELRNFQIEPAIRITAEKTSDSLMRAGFSWPEIDPTYIRKFISCLGGIRLKEN